MNFFLSKKDAHSTFRFCFLCLVLLWFCGTFLGIFFSYHMSLRWNLEQYAFVSYPASSLCQFLAVLIPYVVCLFALCRERLLLLYFCFFLMSFARAVSTMFLFFFIGAGAWVIRFSFLFSSSLAVTLLWWLVFNRLWWNVPFRPRNALHFTTLFLIICFLDFSVISPFVSGFLEYV